jgi:CRP-like cAMP-binding protein
MPATPISAETFLARLPLFQDLHPEQRTAIAASVRQVRAPRGTVLFHRGDPALGMYVVVYGQVKLAFVAASGAEKVVDFRGPGASFGEAVMFLEVPHVVTAQVIADALLLYLPREAVFERIDRDTAFARRMIGGLARRLHQLICEVESLSTRSGTERVIGFLLRDCGVDGELQVGNGAPVAVSIELPIAKGMIASRLNLTQEHFSRILHDLSAAGLIEVHGRRIHVPDLKRLREYAPG